MGIIIGIVGYADESGLLILLGISFFGLECEVLSFVDDGEDGTFFEVRSILHRCAGFVLEFIYSSVIFRQKNSKGNNLSIATKGH